MKVFPFVTLLWPNQKKTGFLYLLQDIQNRKPGGHAWKWSTRFGFRHRTAADALSAPLQENLVQNSLASPLSFIYFVS